MSGTRRTADRTSPVPIGTIIRSPRLRNLRRIYAVIFPDFAVTLGRELSRHDTVLDLACGCSSPIQHCSKHFSVGVDLFEPYLEESKRKRIHDQYIRADITKIQFKPKSFDIVMAIDVFEHLTKTEGLELLGRLDNWAKKKVIVFTPNGFLPQEPYHDNPLQQHKSGWTVQELRRLGFEVHGINGWKALKREMALPRYRPRFLWGRISDLTQKVTYHRPEMAFQLLAIKHIGNGVRDS